MLFIGYSFNKSINKLPNSINSLTLGRYFNQPVDNLPSNLIQLTLGHDFDKLINNLPSNLINLTLGYNFNRFVDNLPDTVKQIKIRERQMNLLKKIPFGCIIIDFNDKILLQDKELCAEFL